ncbi:MAG: hypothetical protein HQL67_08630 [Magnetococcales bacterium]|nr:hypothetical protein [Magnetococcales bacterium]
MNEKISSIVADAVQEINEMRDPDQQVPTEPETIIFGERGLLDSMGIISLTVAIERRVETQLAVELNLTEEILDMDVECLTIGSLIRMITERAG